MPYRKYQRLDQPLGRHPTESFATHLRPVGDSLSKGEGASPARTGLMRQMMRGLTRLARGVQGKGWHIPPFLLSGGRKAPALPFGKQNGRPFRAALRVSPQRGARQALVLKSFPTQPLARIRKMHEHMAMQAKMNHIVCGSFGPCAGQYFSIILPE